MFDNSQFNSYFNRMIDTQLFYDEGYRAFQENFSQHSNPYHFMTPESKWWNRGWQAAHDEKYRNY